MQFYKRFIGDYGRDTAILTMEQDGAYGRLLDYYYATEKPLPADHEELYLIARAMSAGQRKSVDAVVARFFELGDDGYRNPRADKEIEKHKPEADASRENGKLGGRPKKPEPKPKNNPTGYEQEPKHNLSHSQNQKEHSEPSGSGASRPMDPLKTELWNVGRKLLIEQSGMEKEEAGTVLGKLVKDLGQPAMLDAVRHCVRASVADPKTYLLSLKRGEGKQAELERHNDEVLRQALEAAHG